jgi:hypothetical protein
MRRAVIAVCLTFVALMAYPRAASADEGGFWAWLEELSGPGPFKGYKTFLATACKSGDNFKLSPVTTEKGDRSTVKPLPCVYFDMAYLVAEAQRGFPRTRVHMHDAGFAVRLIDGLDVGAGIGNIAFFPETSPATESHSQIAFVPIRLVARPILLLNSGKHQTWMGALSVYWKDSYVPGPFKGPEFGVTDAVFHRDDGDLLGSFGVSIDLTAAVCAFKIAKVCS